MVEIALKAVPGIQKMLVQKANQMGKPVIMAPVFWWNIWGAKAVVTTTHSGFTAQQVSRFKPKTKLIVLSPDRATVLRLALYWAAFLFWWKTRTIPKRCSQKTAKAGLDSGFVTVGDLAVLTAGHPIWVKGTTR